MSTTVVMKKLSGFVVKNVKTNKYFSTGEIFHSADIYKKTKVTPKVWKKSETAAKMAKKLKGISFGAIDAVVVNVDEIYS